MQKQMAQKNLKLEKEMSQKVIKIKQLTTKTEKIMQAYRNEHGSEELLVYKWYWTGGGGEGDDGKLYPYDAE
jgi:hypothetical protein